MNRAAFVFLIEGRDAFLALAEVARDATLPPNRRKLSRAEAKRRYERARADLAWLLDLTPVLAAPSCNSASEPLFEGWAE
jgi:hypothetical protein